MLLKKDNLAISYDIELSKMVICEIEYHAFFSVPQQDRIYYLLEKIDSRNGMPYFKCHTITESYSAKDAISLETPIGSENNSVIGDRLIKSALVLGLYFILSFLTVDLYTERYNKIIVR